MNWWPVERWEALRLALGARGALPREVGSPPASKGCLASILAPPTAPSPRAVREGLANLGRIAPREREGVFGRAMPVQGHSSCPGRSAKRVFALDVPGIHVFLIAASNKARMAGTSPATTNSTYRF